MSYIVNLNRAIDFAPSTVVEEVLQNVRTILSTVIGSVPLHRDFGVSWEHIDKPLPVARTLMQAAIIDAIDEFEPRAKVVSVTFDMTDDDALEGILRPTVKIEIEEGE
jgi:phage baseplate assembly protein W